MLYQHNSIYQLQWANWYSEMHAGAEHTVIPDIIKLKKKVFTCNKMSFHFEMSFAY